MADYDRQDRGSQEGYAAYFAGMNASMQQKVALTTAHFPPQGTVADMGSGSGQATFDLANLYDGLDLVGVDINATAVEMSEKTWQRHNLRYQAGDIADALFPPASLDGILNSSVLHHVTSFNGFSVARVHTLLDNQVNALRDGGVLIVRDFVVPRGPPFVVLELPSNNTSAQPGLEGLSTAALFEVFARDFRSSQNREGAVPHVRLSDAADGWRRYQVALRAATEFVLRKDYRDHWAVELQEEYTYFSQADFEAALRARGMRLVVSVELFNPWIVHNRYAGQVRLTTLEGTPLPFPPTNYLVVAEKVKPGEGVVLEEMGAAAFQNPSFLKVRRFTRQRDGQVMELAVRPHRTVDVVPWFEAQGRLYVLARHGFPRPIVNARLDAPDLLALRGAGYITEPLAAIVPESTDVETAARGILKERAGIEPKEVLGLAPSWRYFTSPGGIAECVDAMLVRVAPWRREKRMEHQAAFSTSGSVRFMDATQVLRASHVGGMFDARLELNIYRLCRDTGTALGPWIGAGLTLDTALRVPATTPVEEALGVPVRQAFEPAPDGPPQFLELRKGTFVELDARGSECARAAFEYVVPRVLSHNTLSVLPLMRAPDGTVLVGLELRDLPAVQLFEGTSALRTVPACRLPRAVETLDAAEAHAKAQFTREFGLNIRALTALGGRYLVSAGVTPEVVYPYAAHVDAVEPGATGQALVWCPLKEVLAQVGRLRDGHLLVALFRAGHALGV